MSFSSLLREVDTLSEQRAERVRFWTGQGHAVSLDRPQQGARLLSFTAHRKHDTWQGMVDVREWLTRALPGLEALLPSGCADHEIAQLFEAARAPLQLPIHCLRYRRLSEVRLVVDAEEVASLPAVETGLGRVWVTHLPAAPRLPTAPIPNWIRALPTSLVWTLGSSPLSRRDLARLACGDVLQIVECRSQVTSAHRRIGGFTFTDNGLKMECTMENLTASSEASTRYPSADAASEGQVSVQLEFVLHEQVCTLSELAALTEGKVLPLSLDCARAVQVRVNGHVLAQGELVRWEDRLGVQLHTVHRGGA